jgi:hypothetical protein
MGLPAAGAVESIQGERSGVLAASPERNYLMLNDIRPQRHGVDKVKKKLD